MANRLSTWIRISDAPGPILVRRLRRDVARAAAIRQSGSITAFMDEVIAEAPSRSRHPTGEAGTAPREPRPGGAHRSRRSIVAVSTYPLHPRQSGGQLRGWHLTEALTADGSTDVTIITLTTSAERSGRYELAPGLTEVCVPIPDSHTDRETRLRLVAGPQSITDIAAALMWNGIPEFTATLSDALDDAAAAILVQPYLNDAVRTLGDGLATICDEHNDELLLKRSILPRTSGGQWLLRQVDRCERSAIESSCLTTATTSADLETLGARYRLPEASAVVPNGVDTTEISFVVGEARERRCDLLRNEVRIEPGRPIALFVGSGHLPNIDAGRSIIDLARQVPDVEFLLAGRHSLSLGRARLPRNVHLMGLVSDPLHELLLSGADLALNPMAAGGGSNLKLLSYLAAGLPVVSTVVGARGVDAEAAGVLTVEVEDLADGVRTIIGAHHTSESSERALAGRHYVEEHCDWRAIGRRFAALVEEQIA